MLQGPEDPAAFMVPGRAGRIDGNEPAREAWRVINLCCHVGNGQK